ncbi:MAG: DUF3021 domain-containing protein [Lachnospiraceae bacterium]|nr:DUF3021 domain-containing protein [Lachnospiraceae bacterium]
MKNEKKLSLWERYLTKEIGIEFKACLYFFAILFFYCVYRVVNGVYSAEILHLAEMIFTCYIIGYIQVYLFANFDEAEKLGGREIAGIIVCTCLYCLVSFFGGWFDKGLPVTAIFAAYLLVTYICVFYIYRSKRRIDDRQLNEELRLFQTQHKKVHDEGK